MPRGPRKPIERDDDTPLEMPEDGEHGGHQEPSAKDQDQDQDQAEDEWEEETRYMILDLGSDVPASLLESAAAEHQDVSLMGLDTPTPYLRIANLTFRGALDRTLGTDLIFSTVAQEDDRSKRPPPPPPHPSPPSLPPPLQDDLPSDVDAGNTTEPIQNGAEGGLGDDMVFLASSTIKAMFTRIQLERKQPTGPAAGSADGSTRAVRDGHGEGRGADAVEEDADAMDVDVPTS
ncbi:hypothetical protein HKX48_007723 [Thoreauomyces humboldtii]|nr:hypothetical protein HKX48_007723 [Thoreauomyces humboldtii]